MDILDGFGYFGFQMYQNEKLCGYNNFTKKHGQLQQH